MAEKLYYSDPYQKEFKATITEKEKIPDGWKIQLDRTAFYPEGGGQPADKGTLNDIPVFDVQKEDDRVYHYVKELPAGGSVSGLIDWKHRFDYMQQHTGQHILSALLKRILHAATVAVHQAEDYMSIEIDLISINNEQILIVQEKANQLVCSNQPVYSFLNGNTPIAEFPIRRETKFTENVRLVQIGGKSLESASREELKEASISLAGELDTDISGLKDLAACGGVHTTRTGEVGLIKYKGQEKVRGRIRLFWLIGKRAYDDYRIKTEITDKIGEALSVPLSSISSEFDRFVSSLGDEKKKNSDLLKEMAFLKAEEIQNDISSGQYAFIFDSVDPGYFKQIIICLSSFVDITVCLINRKGDEGQWALISTGTDPFDFELFRSDMLPLVQGKGGGKAPLWQGKIGDCSALKDFSDKFSSSLT